MARRWNDLILPLLALLALLLVALLLRLHALDAEPWFDEVTTQLRDAGRSLAEIAGTYGSQNKHVLYSLLARLSTAASGESVAALRLPAAVFGVLGVLALFLFARAVASTTEALLAAAVLTFSYHHVWFSQNARGYTMLLFWTLLSSLLLLRALDSGRRQTWITYACVLALGAWTHLTMLFVVAGHLALYARRLTDEPASRASARVALVWGFGLAMLLTLLLYAPIVPSLIVVNTTEGLGRRVPTWKSTSWMLSEVLTALRGAFLGVGVGLVALLVGALGARRFWRERPVVLEIAFYPVAIAAAVVLGSGHDLWPRFFFFALGFAVLILVAGAMRLGELLAASVGALHGRGRAVGATLVLLVVALEAATVSRAWGPKQSYREALALVTRERQPGDAVVAVGWARYVLVDYYGADLQGVRTLEELREVRSHAPRTWLVHSFPVAVAAMHADIVQELRADFELVGRFDGTLNGGEVLVWRSAAEEGRHATTRD